jgi:opacity protein-like surface antigen
MKRFLLVAAVMALGLAPMQAEDAAGPVDSPVAFPVRIEAATRSGGQGLKSGEAFYELALRSVKAVRIAEPYTFTYRPRTLDRRNINGSDSSITLPAGTILVMAVAKDGELFCTAASEGEDSGMTFYDVGYCVRDTDNDGIFDRELVIEQNPWRVRVAYEIVSTHGAAWRPTKLAYQPVEDVPSAQIRFSYHLSKDSGWLFKVKARAYYSGSMEWSEALVLVTKDGLRVGRSADFFIGAFRSDGFGDTHSVVASENIGKETEITVPPFGFKLKLNPDNTLDAEVNSGIAPGPALLAVAGRHWTVNDYRYQGTIMRLMLLSVK